MQIEQLKPIIEAALLAASQPLTLAQLGDLFNEEDAVARDDIARALEQLAQACEGRGVELREVASGFRYQVRQDLQPWVSRMWTERPSRYSRALLETLALIAYRQPITRPEIEQIRGVVVSSNIIKTLEEREWIRVVGHRDVPGRPALFGTTRIFLDYFNLKSLDELPPLSEIRDMEDPQLSLEQPPLPARVIKDLPIDPDADESDTTDTADSETAPDATSPSATHADQASADDLQALLQADTDNQPTNAPVTATQVDTGPIETSNDAEAASELAPADVHPSVPPTAAEAADRAEAGNGTAEQDTEEQRA